MPILNINTNVTGLAGSLPRLVYLYTSDDLTSTVVATGYLNKAVQNGATFYNTDMVIVAGNTGVNTAATSGLFNVSIVGENTSLVAATI
jgi:hypothetical protein